MFLTLSVYYYNYYYYYSFAWRACLLACLPAPLSTSNQMDHAADLRTMFLSTLVCGTPKNTFLTLSVHYYHYYYYYSFAWRACLLACLPAPLSTSNQMDHAADLRTLFLSTLVCGTPKNHVLNFKCVL